MHICTRFDILCWILPPLYELCAISTWWLQRRHWCTLAFLVCYPAGTNIAYTHKERSCSSIDIEATVKQFTIANIRQIVGIPLDISLVGQMMQQYKVSCLDFRTISNLILANTKTILRLREAHRHYAIRDIIDKKRPRERELSIYQIQNKLKRLILQ